MVVGTQWRDVGAIVAVDVEARTGPVRLTPPDGASWSLLDCWDGACRCALVAPPECATARVRTASTARRTWEALWGTVRDSSSV